MRGNRLVPALLLLSLGACAWGDERDAIKERLAALVRDVNAGRGSSLDDMAHASRIAAYFTEDVVVRTGDGSAPIEGRQMLMGMALRLQGRTDEYTVDLEDVTVQLGPAADTAAVDLTAEFIRSEPGARQSMDAREFKLTMRRQSGAWMIAGVEAVQTLR